MQDRYAGDVGDYVKFALLRQLAPGQSLGIAWYLHPDESHNGDGRHMGYLNQPQTWRDLDPELFDRLAGATTKSRTVAALVHAGVVPAQTFVDELMTSRDLPARDRSDWREAWFARALQSLDGCDLVFADPDNGLVDDDPRRRRQRSFGKQLPLSEALALAAGRTAVIYHHNTRRAGGHDAEVAYWRGLLGRDTIAVRATAWSCRTFFIVNPTEEIQARAEAFAARWARHKVRMDG